MRNWSHCGSSCSTYDWLWSPQGMKVFFLIVVALYILYLVFLVVRACSELKNMPYSGDWPPHPGLLLLYVSHRFLPHTVVVSHVSITRSSTQIFDSADVCGPHYKVRLIRTAKPELFFNFPTGFYLLMLLLWFLILLPLFSQCGHSLPEVWCQSPPKQCRCWVVYTLPKLYPFQSIQFYPGFYSRVGFYVAFIKYVHMHFLTLDLPAEFLSFYGLLNFYLYTLAFVYSPSKNALYGRLCNTKHDAWKCFYSPVKTLLFCRHPVQRQPCFLHVKWLRWRSDLWVSCFFVLKKSNIDDTE